MKDNAFLVVDNNAVAMQQLSDTLKYLGYKDIHTTSTASEAWAMLRVKAFDCVFSAWDMPEMTGLELQEKLNSSGWKLPTIFITAYETPKDRNKALTNGAIAFLQKPLNDEELLESIHSALESSE